MADAVLRIRLQSSGANKYPAKAHARRVAEQLKSDDGLIVLAATKASNWPNSDMPAPFRQDRYFYYMTGCNEPDCYVSYQIQSDLLTLWLPPIDKARVVWYGRGSTVEEALEKYDVDAAHYITPRDLSTPGSHPMDGFWTAVGLRNGRDVGEGRRLWVMNNDRKDNETRQHAPRLVSGRGNPNALQRALDACRVIKDEYEIALIRRANAVTADGHVNVMRGIHGFVGEPQVEAAYMQVCIARRHKEQAYDVIAGSGANAAELHYSRNADDFGHGQTVVLDAGCEAECYASDVTRTLPINKERPGHWPSRESADIYALVQRIQESCIERMRPGTKMLENYWHAHEMTIEGLLDLGILKGGSVEEIFAAGTSRAFLPHGLGHHVGLDVHDVSPASHPPLSFHPRDTSAALRTAFAAWKPDWSAHALSAEWWEGSGEARHVLEDLVDAPALAPGMVVTVEPGIYFNAFLLHNFFLNKNPHRKFIDRAALERYMPVGGVRIEDDILITRHGYENLTLAPKGDAMLQVIRNSAPAARQQVT